MHRILGQHLGRESFTELGWTVLRNDPAPDPALPPVKADFVLADPRQGVLLVQRAPSCVPEAAEQLRRRLDWIGFEDKAPGHLPIIALSLTDDDVWRLTGLLDSAFAAEPPIAMEGQDWIALVQHALLVAPSHRPEAVAAVPQDPAPPAPVMRAAVPVAPTAAGPAPVPRPASGLRSLHLFWVAAVLLVACILALLHYLGPPRGSAPPRPGLSTVPVPVQAVAPSPVPEAPPAAAAPLAPPPPPAPPAVRAEAPLPPLPERRVEDLSPADALPLPPPPAPAFAQRPVPEPPRDWSSGESDWPADPAESGGPARIFVHHHRSQRDAAESFAGRARRLGGSVEIRAVPATPPNGEIRYFNPGDRGLAERLAGNLGGGFRLRDFTSFSPRPSRGTLEVWVPGRGDSWD